MTLQDAFKLLITQRGWYKESGILQEQAARDKRFFLQGRKIPEDRIRYYLSAAGWVQTQQEAWEEKDTHK